MSRMVRDNVDERVIERQKDGRVEGERRNRSR